MKLRVILLASVFAIQLSDCFVFHTSRLTKLRNKVTNTHTLQSYKRKKYDNTGIYVQPLSLDQTVLPRKNIFLNRYSFLIAIIILIGKFLMSKFQEPDLLDDDEENFFSKFLSIPIKFFKNRFASISGSVTSLVDRVLGPVEEDEEVELEMEELEPSTKEIKKPKSDKLDLTDWNVCIFTDREKLSENYIKYKFELPDHPRSSLPLGLGQELVLCNIDERGNALKRSFFPVSNTNAKGYFEVISTSEIIDYDDDFVASLEDLNDGDELAVKSGKYQLNYKGPDDPILGITIICSGNGIASALSLIRAILPDLESTVEDIELLWLNYNKNGFILNSVIENLELRYGERFFVTRVIDKDTENPDSAINEQVQEAISSYSTGRIAVIATPTTVVQKSMDLLEDMGFLACSSRKAFSSSLSSTGAGAGA